MAKLTYFLPLSLLLTGCLNSTAHISVVPPTSPNPMMQAANPMQPPADSPANGLWVTSEEGQTQVFPLKNTSVNATVSGNVSQVEVTQTFENPFEDPLEAVYVFPLPDEAAVYDMEIKLGDRIIKGSIKKREEAQEIYEQARAEGRTAGLLEQERANIFTQSLANIRPGEKIEVTIRYTDSLTFEGGNYEFVFPMVVGPRYIPGNSIQGTEDTDQVPDASRITPPVLKPGTRSGHDIQVSVNIDAGVPISNISSTSHKILVRTQRNITEIQLSPEDQIPNKDLVLRYQVSGQETQATILTQKDRNGGHFAAYLIPALDYQPKEIIPKDVVFLMDTSGSQSGAPIAQSQALMRAFIQGLNPDDTFTIIDFSDTARQLSASPLTNTPQNRQKALSYINQLNAEGGTELMNGINAVMNFPPPPEGRLRSVVLLTDGYIGNDQEIIAAVQKNLQRGNRLYSFGVGSSTNRFLLDRLAEVGRGTVQVVRQDENIDPVVKKFFSQINNPVLSNIEVTWSGAGEAPEIYPLAPPDLFASQPLVLFGRKADSQNGTLSIRGGSAGGKRYEQVFSVNFRGDSDAIAQLWGRAKIKDLMTAMYGGETKSGVDAVTQTALDYRLLSEYTAFIAVSEEVRVNPNGERVRVEVPVELPDGVSYEGIFGEPEDQAVMQSAGTRGASRSASPLRMSAPMPAAAPPPPAPLMDSMEMEVAEEEKVEVEPRIEVVKAEGLSEEAIAALTEYIQSISLPDEVSGDLTLEIWTNNGRVRRVLLDEENSTIEDENVVQAVRSVLLGWPVPSSVQGTVSVTLRVNGN
ncbi:VIT domain-containing protein [Roseofilum sp. BLCC_M154]|uniref:VIT domain-containing protein n=1 Tax=Roseofilum acuticapitatum BLCC-M154 TaxID=3022444 RepID=A0ABT7AUD3_9CYAN|nr:VIT domain-containing protein [Roseofilum acuticapitatum]MDJ1170522.1 VIT domain-containing protein [Roseofilum acuticapitatum BLCC-M154]